MNDLLTWTNTLESRRNALEARLYAARIADLEITVLSYLDIAQWHFREASSAAARMLVLYALSLAAYKPDKRGTIVIWLQQQALFIYLTPQEKAFLQSNATDARTLAKYSWSLEGAYILAWTMDLVPLSPDPASEAPIASLLSHIPHLHADTAGFINHCHYREKEELVDEYIFNDLAVLHLRRLYEQGARTVQQLHPMALYERRNALKWITAGKP
ncbi:protein of unknown function [Chitinophaga costaii]|uniref:DUF4272 domain-containing protein n=1 Tax=Chitinophaga costaii TaxID=1335309 RepID=A0A1C4CH26_9BACT|nr:DUF4272 domain-containing protein [Chitinophaga costaii]PUZ27095.1 DUF4272 domain-containing protein [Chitinophaga costaii]SCC18313.1 protein of unknown function [Chitinophaga costaii]